MSTLDETDSVNPTPPTATPARRRPGGGTGPSVGDDDVLPAPGVWARVRGALSVITVVGWSILALGAMSWVLGWRLGWTEFMFIAAACVTSLLVSVVFIFGRATLDVAVEIQPQRVVVGDRAAGQMTVTNASGRRLLPLRMELVVGAGAADFDVPSLGAGDTHDEIFVLPTERRGIIPVGPATSVRGDPLGALRRAVPWTEPIPLFVHPRTVPLGYLGAGLLRDLEGQPTADLSPSDIAFHALREYEVGDDRRFIHWLTTARVGKLMVRQFTDTRRAHLAVLVDAAPASFDSPDSFEDAVSVAGSLGVRALADEQELTIVVGGRRVSCVSGRSMLDGLAGVEMSGRSAALSAQADDLVRKVTGVSLAIVVTGARPTIPDLRAVSLKFPVDVRTMIVRIDPGATTGFRPIGSTLVLTVASLDEFSHLMWAVANA